MFFMHCCGVPDLLKACPILNSLVAKWEKLQPAVKQALTFEKEDFSAFFAMPNTPDLVSEKVYCFAMPISYENHIKFVS